jgi:hypothetical protein
VTGAGKTLEGVGDSTGQLGSDYYAIAESYNQERMRLLQLMEDIQKEERDALASIAEFAVRLAGIGDQVRTVQMARDALHESVGALKEISVALRVASTFWKQMANYCKEVATSTLKDKVTLYKDLPINERIELYVDPDFKLQVVEYLAGWKALSIVAREYSAECAKLTGEIQADFMKNPTIEESIRETPKLAAALLYRTQQDLAKTDAKSEAIKTERGKQAA